MLEETSNTSGGGLQETTLNSIASQKVTQKSVFEKPTPGKEAQIKSLLRSDHEEDVHRAKHIIQTNNFNPKKF